MTLVTLARRVIPARLDLLVSKVSEARKVRWVRRVRKV